MLKSIRKSRLVKVFAVYMAISFLVDIVNPIQLFALTSGPSQPEVQSFEPVGTTDMVDLFSGDFTYNIPLFELPGPDGGYPFNIAYHSGITMDQEASWVGLGWNLNPGAITRDVRNLPDEFDGTDIVRIKKDMKTNWTAGGGISTNLEVVGGDGSVSKKPATDGPISFGIDIYYNNYKGVGYGLKGGYASVLGSPVDIDLSMDSQEGVGVSPSINFSKVFNTKENSFKLKGSISTGYNSRQGLTSFSLNLNLKDTKGKLGSTGVGGNSTFSFAATSFSPQVETPYQGRNLNLKFKLGLVAGGTFSNGTFSGFFNTQYISQKDKDVSYPAVGYMHLQKSKDNMFYVTDINRENDGMIRKSTKNLPIPNLTYDIYSVTGQGVGNMYRPYRSDYGIVSDKITQSNSMSSNLGAEAGLGVGARAGADAVFACNNSVSSGWDIDLKSQLSQTADFKDASYIASNALYEPFYFKTFGEHTADDDPSKLVDRGVYDEYPAYVELDASQKRNCKVTNMLIHNGRKDMILMGGRITRKPRGVSMQPVTIKDLINNGNIRLSEYKIKYLDHIGDEQDLDRNHKENHIAGYTTVSAKGERYVYALPAYNNDQREYVFSVPSQITSKVVNGVEKHYFPKTVDFTKEGNDMVKHDYSDHYYKETDMPAYPYAYMLTSVLGADYVDIDNIPGPSDGDLGYWVKFNYQKITNDDYIWKAPYSKANYLRGLSTNGEDDKGAFMWGKKEIWILESAETKTHIAKFISTERSDGRDAITWDNQGSATSSAKCQKKLERIDLYSKAEFYVDITSKVERNNPTPIKSVNFEYSYDLCKKVENNFINSSETGLGSNVNNGGKLTLKKMWFTYKKTERGSLNPYVFDYHENNKDENPDYNSIDVDRWGNYKESDELNSNVDNPYVEQDKSIADKNSSVWNLKGITMPSGGSMEINYESDSYAYVQDQIAMQMTPIIGLESGIGDATIDHPKVNSTNNYDGKRKVYFNLEVPTSDDKDLEKYIKIREEIYFKVRIKLTSSVKPGDSMFEYVGGYVPVQDLGFDETSIDSDGKYNRAYVVLNLINVGTKQTKYHPFSVAAWQHIRTNQPELITDFKKNISDVDNISNAKKKAITKSLVTSVFSDFGMIFSGFYDYMHNTKKFATEIDLDHSWIRLRTVDKEKFGGGCRVKSLVFHDNWDKSTTNEPENVYGTVYNYTKKENGVEISSGVAQYEPMIGGDEIALRKPIWEVQKIPLKTDNNLYSELPYNENLYPGASVGYSEVTSMSLATYCANLKSNPLSENVFTGQENIDFTNLISTTGKTVTEFYTARDYPVRSTATTLSEIYGSMTIFTLHVPVFGVGAKSTKKITASQGYSIILNDMHGKLKKISNYSQDKDLIFSETPISYIEYIYSDDSGKNHKDGTKDLVNKLPVMLSDQDSKDPTRAEVKTMDIGVDYDFFIDMRQSTTKSNSMGGAANFETVLAIIPGVFPWPSFSTTKNELRTVVTNKIIHKSGILLKVVAKDEQSLIATENKYFDPLTGEALLTTVTNNFDKPVYNYNMPAYWAYDEMGAAYKNIGFEFSALSITKLANYKNYYCCEIYNSNADKNLVPGDELIVKNVDNKVTFIKFDEVVNSLGEKHNNLIFHSIDDIRINFDPFDQNHVKKFKVVRSGRRNLLTNYAANITALNNPTENRKNTACDLNYDKQELGKTYSCPTATIQSIKISEKLMTDLAKRFVKILNNHINVNKKFFGSDGLVLGESTVSGGIIEDIKIDLSEDYLLQAYYNPFNDNDTYISIGLCPNRGGQLHIGIKVNAGECSDPWLDHKDFHFLSADFDSYEIKNVEYDYKNSKNYIKFNFEEPGPENPDTYTTDEGIFNFETQRYIFSTSSTQPSLAINCIDKILSSTATIFGDTWSRRGYGVNYGTSIDDENPYHTGEKGIWLPFSPMVYTAERNVTASPNLKDDGTFDNMPIFNWQNPDFFSNVPGWISTEQTTRIGNSSNATESRNILGIYSSALFGFGGKYMIANAQNARQGEIGFENFEEQQLGALPDISEMSLGNIDIYSSGSATKDYESYRILYSKGNVVVIDKPYSGYDQAFVVKVSANIPAVAKTATTAAKKAISVTGSCRALLQDATSSNIAGFNGKSILVLKTESSTLSNLPDEYWTGTLEIEKFMMPLVDANNSQIVNNFAHTGSQSLELVTGVNRFPQNRLSLMPGNDYIFSAWVKCGFNYPVATFKGLGDLISIVSKDLSDNETLYGGENAYVGQIIDGWQKVEIPFQSTKQIELLIENNSGVKMYVDDIRIHPKEATMETYVYDKVDYKPMAFLDNNNYAVLYFYNEEGKHYLTKRETERGIFTIKETRTFTSQIDSQTEIQ